MYSLMIALIMICDFLTKQWAGGRLKRLGDIPVLSPVLHFTYVENSGIAWGMLQNGRWVFVGVSVLVVLGIAAFWYKRKPQNPWLQTGMAFVLGGAAGNLIDRLFAGYVVDFINLKFISFPVFNIADIFVCVGAVLVGVYYCFLDKKEA